MIYTIKFPNYQLRINKNSIPSGSKNGPLLPIILTEACDVVFIGLIFLNT